MSKMGKSEKKLTEKLESFESYEEDFEDYDFDFGDEEMDNNGTLVTPSVSMTSTAISMSPETDSAGNDLNTKSHDLAGGDMTSSLESDYDYQEDDSAYSQNYNFRLFREALNEVPMAKQKRYKNGTRSSLTFSNQRVREIDRANQLLLEKIMRNGPSGDGNIKKNSLSAGNQRPAIRSNAEVNRKKQQDKIEYENQLLRRKLNKISIRQPLV